jgi:hypothetical protein
LRDLFQSGNKTVKLEEFKRKNNLNEVIPVYICRLIYYDINSIKGKELLISRFNENLKDLYLDSLRNKYKIKTHLLPPTPPRIDISDLIIHYKGNLNSEVNLIVVSDFDCSICRENKVILDDIYNKYKNKIKYGYTSFGSYVSLSAIAAECAASQGKFWEMHDSIYNKRNILNEESDVLNLAYNLNLDMDLFSAELNDKYKIKDLEMNFNKIDSLGIYGTPTIIINGRIIFNSSSINEIEKS